MAEGMRVSGERHEFKLVSVLRPDAVGVPGKRRFRLLVEGEPGSACLWLEKEQLQALGLAIDQMLAPLATLWSLSPTQPTPTVPPADFPPHPTVEFQVGRLALAFDEASQQFILLAHDVEADQDGPATLTCRATRSQMRALSQSISVLAAAGRPRCPLCGQPIEDGSHVCPGSNGHTLSQP